MKIINIIIFKVILCASEQISDIASEALTTLKRAITCIHRCERPCFNRYRPKHFCQRTLFAPVRHSPTNKLCIAPLIFEHRTFSGHSFNFGNFRFLKKLPVFFYFLNILPSFSKMYEGIYLVFILSLCIFVDMLTVCYTLIHFL